MAQKIRKLLHASIGISTTGIETPTYHELYISIATETYQNNKKYTLSKQENNIKEKIKAAALGTLYFFLSSRQQEVLN